MEGKRLQYKKERIPDGTNKITDQVSPSSDICKGLQLGNTKNAIRTHWGSELEWTKAEIQQKVSITISSLLLTLLTAALSLTWSLSGLEGLSKAVCLLFCFKANQNWVHMQLSNASINQSVTDTDTPWINSKMLPTEHRTMHHKNPHSHETHLDLKISRNSNSDHVFKIYDQSQVQFSARMAHTEICHSQQRAKISQGYHLFKYHPNWILLILGHQMRFCFWWHISK